MRTPLLFAALLALVCLHVNDNVSPEAAYTRSLRRKAFRATDVMALLEPRTWVDFGKYSLFVASRDGETLQDLRVNEALPGGRTREIRAATARVATGADGRAILRMTDVTIDPWRDNEPGMSHAETWQLPLSAISGRDDSPAERERPPVRRTKDRRTWELARDVVAARAYPPVPSWELERLDEMSADLAAARDDLAHPAEASRAAVSNAVVRAAAAALEAAGAEIGSIAPSNAAAAEAAVSLLSGVLASASAPALSNALAASAAAGLANAVAAAAEHPIKEPDEAELASRVARAEGRLETERKRLEPAFRAEKNLSRAKVEIGVRATLAVACLCFVLVGIPLGMQSHRRQSSVGIGISLAVAGAFYVFCIAAESLSKHPELHAYWLLPVPVVVCVVLGVVLIRRHN
jgi:hypothetical protein